MAGLVPAIHAFTLDTKDVDARHKAGHDEEMPMPTIPPPERPAGSVDPKLLEILVCPLTKGPLEYDAARQELISRKAKLAYPIRDGIPIMLPEEARRLD
jgi:uncharacterized protein YbaR (Trm112 family)